MSYEQTAAEKASSYLDVFVNAAERKDTKAAETSFLNFIDQTEPSKSVTTDSLKAVLNKLTGAQFDVTPSVETLLGSIEQQYPVARKAIETVAMKVYLPN